PTLAYALTGLLGAIWWPENSEERLELGLELVNVGISAGLVEGEVDGHMLTLAAYAEMGDFTAARREVRLLSRAGGSLPIAAQRWLEGAQTSLFALSDGDFEESERWIEETIRYRPVTPARDNVSAGLFQLFLLRREQGRLHEVEASVREAAADFPWYHIHRVAFAVLLAVTGRIEDARSMAEELRSDGLGTINRDNYWLASMCLASELAVALGDVNLAKMLLEELTPFATRNAIGFPEGSLGAVARYLGLLASLTGDYDEAVRWFEQGLIRNERNGAIPWVAHTQFELARALILRGSTGDEAAAEAHLRSALNFCDRVGLVALRESVLTALVPFTGNHHPEAVLEAVPDPPTATFRREGEYYSIVFDGAGFKVKDSKGLSYLRLLLGSPAKEIHVLDLVAAERGGEPTSRGRVKDVLEEGGTWELSDPLLDRAAREAYERRLADLQDDIAEAEVFGDHERAETARSEHDFLATELASALGLGGRDRVATSAAERARVNVTRAIRSALAKIDSHSPVLGQHLDTTIRTGVFCSYNPDPLHPFRWDT
ncbi:MAG TPA: hypothetical protein VIA81_09700, partial [Acidimicrobiia bacterium]